MLTLLLLFRPFCLSGNFTEALGSARTGVAEALLSINRQPGAEQQVVHKPVKDNLGSTTRSRRSSKSNKDDEDDVEVAENTVLAILPKYEIDSSSRDGLKPPIVGAIKVQDAHFTYPTRPDDPVLNGMTLDIEAGQTVAFVGPSGGGKSTIVAMLERFYDPSSGSISLDGVNIKDINVRHLRGSIGYVGQEPALFATTIRANIKYGNPRATNEEIEEACRLANAHDFISAFSDGYDTQVGDKGSQLSGGQKQVCTVSCLACGAIASTPLHATWAHTVLHVLSPSSLTAYCHCPSPGRPPQDLIAGRSYQRAGLRV
jgi:ATP-binding cassette subfamily B (MDR/TAP) protein 1